MDQTLSTTKLTSESPDDHSIEALVLLGHPSKWMEELADEIETREPGLAVEL